MPDRRVLVVGTTPDYIAYIHDLYKGRALFVTDVSQRCAGSPPALDASSEIVCRLSEADKVLSLLKEHLRFHKQTLSGVTCYDCEWLELASNIALDMRLPYPSPHSVQLSRNKYLTKQCWSEAGVRCPQVRLITGVSEALEFFNRTGGNPIVLKPLSGSGSELTLLCRDKHDIAQSTQVISSGLKRRIDLPMYQPGGGEGDRLDPRTDILAEEYVVGREYSCDFVIDGGHVAVIRIAKKLDRPGMPFGTTIAYLVPARLPAGLDEGHLRKSLKKAAKALGLERAICMVDFMVSRDEIVFLELTPRIGGDCLPPLVRQSCGMDTIELALDFAEMIPPAIPPDKAWRPVVGLRLFAPGAGVLKEINTGRLKSDGRVKEVYLKRSPGHVIALPPDDYDSWILGHVIFEPDTDRPLTRQCEEVKSKIRIEVEPYHDQKFIRVPAQSGGAAQSANTSA